MIGTQEGYIEQVNKGCTLERRHDGQMVIFTISDVRPETLESYLTKGEQVVHDHPRDRPLYMLNDCSHPNVSLTPYFRERLNNMIEFLKRENKTMYHAIVPPNTLFFRIFVLFMNMYSQRVRDVNMTQRAFANRTEALKWLEDLIQKEK
jgi:hypothetical protein